MPGRHSYDWFAEEDAILKSDHALPSEVLTAEPPLPSDMAQWISGKRQRRRDFVQRGAAREFHREYSCGEFFRYQGVTITGSALKGKLEISDLSICANKY